MLRRAAPRANHHAPENGIARAAGVRIAANVIARGDEAHHHERLELELPRAHREPTPDPEAVHQSLDIRPLLELARPGITRGEAVQSKGFVAVKVHDRPNATLVSCRPIQAQAPQPCDTNLVQALPPSLTSLTASPDVRTTSTRNAERPRLRRTNHDEADDRTATANNRRLLRVTLARPAKTMRRPAASLASRVRPDVIAGLREHTSKGSCR